MADIEVLPINKYLLTFKESDLEKEYQEKRRIFVGVLMRSLYIKFNLLLLPIYIYNLYFFIKSGQKGKNIDDPIAAKRIFTMIVTVPFLAMIGLIEIFFSKCRILSKIRFVLTLLIILTIITPQQFFILKVKMCLIL